MRVLEDLPFLDLDDPRFVADPPGFLREAAELAPVVRTARGYYVVDGRLHEQLARDRRLLNAHAGELASLAGLPAHGAAARFRRDMLLNQQGRDHAMLRS